MRLLLGAHRARLAAIRVEEPRLLVDLPARLDELDLAADLVVDRLPQEAERVHVLDLAPGAEPGRALRHDRHVRVAAERPLLQVPVVHAERLRIARSGLEVLDGLVDGAEVRLGDDLEERHAGAVQVDAGAAVRGDVVDVLAGVLLHVDAGEPDPPRSPSTAISTTPPSQMGSSYCEIW